MSAIPTRSAPAQPISGARKPQKASQVKFVRPAQMSLFAQVTSYPPLGQVTCVPRLQKALKSEDDDKVRASYGLVMDDASVMSRSLKSDLMCAI